MAWLAAEGPGLHQVSVKIRNCGGRLANPPASLDSELLVDEGDSEAVIDALFRKILPHVGIVNVLELGLFIAIQSADSGEARWSSVSLRDITDRTMLRLYCAVGIDKIVAEALREAVWELRNEAIALSMSLVGLGRWMYPKLGEIPIRYGGR